MKLPKLNFSQKAHLYTVSIPRGMICGHHFQVFIDNEYRIRGYQKVDLELTAEENEIQKDQDILKHFTLDHNTIKFEPKITEKNLSLKEIYNEFWDFIDDKNLIFREFISEDTRRKKHDLNDVVSERNIEINL